MTAPTVPLGEVGAFVRGVTFKPKDTVPLDDPSGVVCLRTKNVQAEADLGDLLAVPTQVVKRAEQYLQQGDVLISSANSWNLVGKCCWIPQLEWEATFGGFVTVLRPKSDMVDRRYLYHWFSYGRTQQLLRSFGRKTTNISNLDLHRCREMAFPLPPLDEQRRIAAVLDAADALRVKRYRALARLHEMHEAIFVAHFGDPGFSRLPLVPLGELVRSGITRGIDQPGPDDPDGVPYIKTTDFSRAELYRSDLMRASPEIESRFPRSRVELGDTVICIRATVGPTLLVTDELVGANLSRGTARVSPSDEVLPGFLYAAMNTRHFQWQIERRRRGATFLQLPLGELAQLEVLLPSRGQQSRFAESIGGVESVSSVAEAQGEAIESLFGSLQQRAFRGEL